jgi:transitional endoplasmic reticulum ATPase
MNKVVRKNLRVRLGDIVMVKPAGDVATLTRIDIRPFDDCVEGLEGDFTPQLQAYFKDAFRPIKKGDLFIVRGGFKALEFKVLDLEPGEYGIVGPTTQLHAQGEPVKREQEEMMDQVGYDDIGGCRK